MMKVFTRFSDVWGKWIASWWNMLYPRTCVICGDVLAEGESFICSGCLNRVPLDEGEEDGFREELRVDMGVESVYCLFHYDHESDFHRWIYAIKYRGNKKLGVWSGKMLGEQLKDACVFERIIPIPLHPAREKERGFNQAFVIGMGIAEILDVKVDNDIVRRVVNTRSQTGLSREERTDNVKQAFCLTEAEQLRDCHVLLVDDVITTGATIRACVKELQKIPGVRVSVACLGKAGKV